MPANPDVTTLAEEVRAGLRYFAQYAPPTHVVQDLADVNDALDALVALVEQELDRHTRAARGEWTTI